MAALVLVLLFAIAGGGVSADEAVLSDTVGDQGGPMSFDIESYTRTHGRPTEKYPRFIVHTVRASEPVADASLEEEEVQVRFNFDTKGDRKYERAVVVSYAPGQVRADMWRGGYPFVPDGIYEPPDWVGAVHVSRPDDRSIAVWVPRDLLGRAVDRSGSYRWMVEVYRLPGYSSFCDDGDVSPCYDRTIADVHEIGKRSRSR